MESQKENAGLAKFKKRKMEKLERQDVAKGVSLFINKHKYSEEAARGWRDCMTGLIWGMMV